MVISALTEIVRLVDGNIIYECKGDGEWIDAKQRTLLGLTNDVYCPTSMVMSAPASHRAFTASRQFTGHTG